MNKSKLLVQPDVQKFVEAVVPLIHDSKEDEIHGVQARCHRCGHVVRVQLPIIARQYDINRLEKLCQMMDDYFVQTGGREAMMQELLRRLKEALTQH